ncbi:sulfoxide reductase catalytic subunit YedY [Micromonospora sediminicola]|uniref:Sulfoxide reductase catalytic subunit YedY n=1 Tax=Micromonospora sediminicola TaxID=946078 RepID=A0A1A9B9N2_9ACTN|nr:molybdopterin-dependent oxidoreductase [Micromonospora sediminicola]SBT65781.1 sulfoxide reductase catalytic subunit YedY [Micromonospora sediminicola]
MVCQHERHLTRTRARARDVGGRLRRFGRWLGEPLPAPPARWQRGPFRDGAFSSPARSARLSTHLGMALAVAFGVCFTTGLLSHLAQHPPAGFDWPPRPVQFYRVTQGLHVATGLATVPLLAAKLWAVYPELFRWPPARDAAHAVERISVAMLVGAALFELVTGVLNVSLWYTPMPFYFPAAHYWTAWLAVGAILIHVGVKLPVIRDALRGHRAAELTTAVDGVPAAGGATRRDLLGAVAAAAGVITLSTVGQTVAPLSAISVLAPRRPRIGPQRLPVNTSALAAGVAGAAADASYTLELVGPARSVRLSLAELNALRQHTVRLPIACVEGWSADATWTGVRLRDLAALVGVDARHAEATVESLQRTGRRRSSVVAGPHLDDPLTLLAVRLHGEPLHPDHGYPCRLIAPNRPGVAQTKWVGRISFEERP